MRLSLLYSTLQDRLELRAIDNRQRTITLWLTQRLCNMLVKAMVGILDKTVEQPANGDNPIIRPQPGPSVAKGTAQFMEQTRAELAREPSPAVQPPKNAADAEQVLVDALRLLQIRETYVLALGWRDQEIALPMTIEELRQFMRALHSRYRAAEWPIDNLWPDWFSETAHRTYLKDSLVN